jgi:hypothetical protein
VSSPPHFCNKDFVFHMVRKALARVSHGFDNGGGKGVGRAKCIEDFILFSNDGSKIVKQELEPIGACGLD